MLCLCSQGQVCLVQGFVFPDLLGGGAGKENGEKNGINMMDIEKNGENFGIKKESGEKNGIKFN